MSKLVLINFSLNLFSVSQTDRVWALFLRYHLSRPLVHSQGTPRLVPRMPTATGPMGENDPQLSVFRRYSRQPALIKHRLWFDIWESLVPSLMLRPLLNHAPRGKAGKALRFFKRLR